MSQGPSSSSGPIPSPQDDLDAVNSVQGTDALLTPEEVAVAIDRRIMGMGLQAIEGNPLTADNVAMFEMFELERWSHERRLAYIQALFTQPRRSGENVAVTDDKHPDAPQPSPPSNSPRLADRSGIAEWEARAMAGVKRVHEDEAYRLSLNARLS